MTGSDRERDVPAEIKAALNDSEVHIRLVHTFTHGRAAQVYVKSRKVGPLLLPAEGQRLADVLAMLGELAEDES